MKRKLNEHDAPEMVDSRPAKVAKTAQPSFADLNLDPRLLQAITREKFATPTPVQAHGIPLALSGKDVLARAKTGSGKTLAYLLPILHSILRRKAGGGKAAKQTTALILVPTKELATQVTAALKAFTAFCGQEMRYENISKKEDAAVTRARLAEHPDILTGTPSRAVSWLKQDVLNLNTLQHLVIDEADLVLSYGYEDDLRSLASALPTGVQKLMMSATLRTEIDTLSALFFPPPTTTNTQPIILDLSALEAEAASSSPTNNLTQYTVRTAEDDKFLLIYAIFKLQLIKGKVIVFVADVDRCYRVKLFLEQFGIRSCVLNGELPVNSRLRAVEEFNRGLFDILVASDEGEVVGNEDAKRKKRRVEVEEQGEGQDEGADEVDEADVAQAADVDAEIAPNDEAKLEEGPAPTPHKPNPRPKRKPRKDREFGIARGLDFSHVACVLNFDLPTSRKSYTHRIGRTARAGQSGMALSFWVAKELYRKHKPTSIAQCENDEVVLVGIREEQGGRLQEWQFDMRKLEGFRYRFADALRGVTRIAVREARTRELRHALINSEKLKRHFEENPEELRHLRHDTETHAFRQQPHLKHVPDYLLPAGGKQAMSKDVGFIGIRKQSENGLRRRRAFNKSRGKGSVGRGRGRGSDPLRSLNARGRGRV